MLENIRKLAIDVDGTICTNRDSMREETGDRSIDYVDMTPYPDRINIINDLKKQGYYILYWTGRGATSGRDWTELTTKQLNDWGCLYDEVIVGRKPHFDLYVCDKSTNADIFFNNLKK